MKTKLMYCSGLGLAIIGSFENHDGFDGVILGQANSTYHFEFTHCRSHPVAPTPTSEDLAVFYIEESSAWQATCASMRAAGFRLIESFNPYWDVRGKTFEDHDSYRVVLQCAAWSNG